ncbi:unnamed protein product [Bathycoccus prasinos]|mmetsp:Transcript_3191/g.11424  ORF Transcript_3191/g.11424 Transcript_3191/m.11424 type:complete len:196 (+) Transcript_3191:160-747(+)
MGGCCTCVGRKGLWYVWAFNALIASIFSIIAVSHGAVFDKIIVNNKSANAMLDGAIACISCSVFLNIAYLVITALILLRKTIALNGAGAAFGFMIALSLMMFFNQIQVGFFLQSIHPWIEEFIAPAAGKHWTSEDDATHEALVAFAYLSGSTYVVLTFVLFCGSGGLQKSMMDDGPRSIELEHNNSSNNNNTNNA